MVYVAKITRRLWQQVRSLYMRKRASEQWRRSRIAEYFSPHHMNYDKSRLTRAIDEVERIFALPHVRPYHIRDAIRQFSHLDKSPGLPHTQRGIKTKKEYLEKHTPSLLYFIHAVKNEGWKMRTPCDIGWKTTISKAPKDRMIFIYPAHHTFAEAMFVMPFLAKLKKNHPYYWIGRNITKESLSSKIPGDWIATDFKSFDVTVHHTLIKAAFKILEKKIDFNVYEQNSYEGDCRVTNPQSLHRLWKQIVDYFLHTPLVYKGKLYRGKEHGIPSGSMFTNLIGTLVNAIVTFYIASPADFLFFGDDTVWKSTEQVPPFSELATSFKHVFGLTLGINKCTRGSEPEFLGYRWVQGRPLGNKWKMLASFLMPARKDRCFQDAANRAYCISLVCMNQEVCDILAPYLTKATHLHPDWIPKLNIILGNV